MKTLLIDTLDLGRWGGGAQGRQRFVTSITDPASRWVYSEIAPQRLATTPQEALCPLSLSAKPRFAPFVCVI